MSGGGVTGDGPGGIVRHRGAAFWVAAGAGWALIAWGVRGVFLHRLDTRPGQLLRFFVAGLAAHDLILAPAVLVVGVVIARRVPARWRSPLQAALLMSATAALYAYPLIRGYGHALNNPTSLPRNYAAGLAVVVTAVAVGVALAVTAGYRRSRSSSMTSRRARSSAST
ncbi:MAG: hypothetical protein AB1679_03475 [Actinomycetota bacterium]